MIRITVGEVEVRWDGEMTLRQVRDLMREAAGIAVALGQTPEEEPEAKTSVALGFTTETVEFSDPRQEDFWFEESP
jgi:hypothetical protein